MALATHYTADAHGFADRISATVAGLKARYAQYKLYRQTVNELNELSGRELADLGISHAQIRSTAYEAVYGA